MSIIKRYANRKLYNTDTKRYITLASIAKLIRHSEEVQVIDNTTGEDLTALTLSQIIFEQEKQQRGFLPQSVLTGLVRAGGDTLNGLRRALATPLNLLHHVDEEISRRVQSLIKQGELDEQDGLRLLDKLIPGNPFAGHSITLKEEDLVKLLNKRGVPTYDDLEQLRHQLEVLAAKLDHLNQDIASDDD